MAFNKLDPSGRILNSAGDFLSSNVHTIDVVKIKDSVDIQAGLFVKLDSGKQDIATSSSEAFGVNILGTTDYAKTQEEDPKVNNPELLTRGDVFVILDSSVTTQPNYGDGADIGGDGKVNSVTAGAKGGVNGYFTGIAGESTSNGELVACFRLL